MSEIIFMIEEAPEGGYIARAAGESIFTEANDLETLRQRAQDAVYCHFDGGQIPQTIRMHLEASVSQPDEDEEKNSRFRNLQDTNIRPGDREG